MNDVKAYSLHWWTRRLKESNDRMTTHDYLRYNRLTKWIEMRIDNKFG